MAPFHPTKGARVCSYAKPGGQAIVAMVHWAGSRTTTSDVVSKIYQAISLTTGEGDDGTMLVITASDRSSADASKALVETFVRDRLPSIIKNLDAMQAKSTPMALTGALPGRNP